MSGEGLILRIRSFRAMWQLYLEVLFLPLVIPMILGMALWLFTRHYDRDTQFILTIAPYILGIAGGLYLRFFHNGLTGKWVEVLGTGWSWGPSIFPGEPSGI
jgi:ABC-type sugar transport system permease subunit